MEQICVWDEIVLTRLDQTVVREPHAAFWNVSTARKGKRPCA
jgi:hypothetical protein